MSSRPSDPFWTDRLRRMRADVPLWDEMVDVVERAWVGTAHHDLDEKVVPETCPLCIALNALKKQVPGV